MRQSSHHKRNRLYQVKKRSIKDDYIDKQIWVIHQAIVQKLLAQPELLAAVKARLEQYRKTGRLGYSAYITWLSIVELYDDKQAFTQGVLEDSAKMKRLRRETPFVGILSENERKKAIEQGAIGILVNTDALLL